jgi:hypothetical protein
MADRINPTFKILEDKDVTAGVHRLNPDLTINGTTVYPMLRYKGGDANGTNWPAWGYGETLTLQAGTAPSYNQGSPLTGPQDDSVRINSGGYYTGSATLGDIGTDDLVIEIVYKNILKEDTIIFDKEEAGSPYNGYRISTYQGKIALRTRINPSDIYTYALTAQEKDTWYHGMVFLNRNEASTNACKWYINGVLNSAGEDHSANSSSLDFNAPLTIGTNSGGDPTYTFESSLAYFAVWKSADWHKAAAAGPAEWATIAKERFAKLTGVYPISANGTTKTPTIMTRDTSAYLEKSGSYGLYKVGPNWPRFCSKIDKNNDQFFGYLAEKQSINLLLQSEDFTTTWAKADAGDTIAKDVALAPNKTSTANVITASTTDGNHYVVQYGLNLPHGTHTFSTFAKKGDVDFAMLYDGVIGHYAFFNLSTGQVGTVAAGAAAYMESYGNGWYRCAMRFPASESSYGLCIFPAASDNDFTYAGNGASASLYIWGAQLETGSIITSYIPTTTLAVTRSVDKLVYKMDDGNVLNNRSGSLVCKSYFTSSGQVINTDGISENYYWQLSDGAATEDRVAQIGTYSVVPNQVYFYLRSTEGGVGVDSLDDVNMLDSDIHEHRMTWKSGSFVYYLDNTSQVTDTSLTPPNDIDQLDVGHLSDFSRSLNGLISNIKIFSKPTKKG